MLRKYGVDHPMHVAEIREKVKQTILDKYGVYPAFFQDYVLENLKIDMKGKHMSKTQCHFNDVLQSYGLATEQEYIINHRYFDIKISDKNIVFEIDPSYTHSQQDNRYHQILEPNYHLDKTILANNAGYRCIHVFDWDDRLKLGSIFNPNKVKVYARDCNIAYVSYTVCNEFLNDNHLQGSIRNQIINVGLFLGDMLLAVMSFGIPRYTKKYEWELLRYCTKSGYYVIGGAQKLFKFFIQNHEPLSIISYCDRSKFDGDVYQKLGMYLHHCTSPAKVWSKDNKKITDNLLRQRGYDQLFHTNYGKGSSNEELMIEHGWRSVYDCGQKVYVWYK